MINKNNEQVICPKFEHTFSILGKKWTGLIIDVLLTGPHRFKDLSAAIPEVSERVLVERIRELEKEDIVTRPEGEESNPRAGYCLTKKGKDLRQVMDSVQEWSDEWVVLSKS